MPRLLKTWHAGTNRIKKLEGKLSKYTYCEAFVVETRGVGRFFYERPDKGRIDITPLTNRNGANHRLAYTGKGIGRTTDFSIQGQTQIQPTINIDQAAVIAMFN